MKSRKIARLVLRDGFECHYCKRSFGEGLSSLTLDHKVAKVLGGNGSDDNLVLCCKRCNRWKGSMSYEKFLLRLPEIIQWLSVNNPFILIGTQWEVPITEPVDNSLDEK